eukprot:3248629-Pleurochrysis_carterae.AAC.1
MPTQGQREQAQESAEGGQRVGLDALVLVAETCRPGTRRTRAAPSRQLQKATVSLPKPSQRP